MRRGAAEAAAAAASSASGHGNAVGVTSIVDRGGDAENARLENAGLELSAPYDRGWKMRDWKIREQETYGTPRVA